MTRNMKSNINKVTTIPKKPTGDSLFGDMINHINILFAKIKTDKPKEDIIKSLENMVADLHQWEYRLKKGEHWDVKMLPNLPEKNSL